jgi:hypothetical protein
MLYAYIDVHGPITHRFPASISWGEAAKEIETNGQKWIDEASSDLDDDVECDLSSLSEKEMYTLFMKYGKEMMNIDTDYNGRPIRGGWILIEIDTLKLVTIETMPEHLCESHKQANNWGIYPHNGAERQIVTVDGANEIIENDAWKYAHIV